MKKLNVKEKALFLIGLISLLSFGVGAVYAYFQVNVNNNATTLTITGQSKNYGTVSLITNTSKLYLTFSGNEMGEANKGKTYYANIDSSGSPLTENPNYSLVTISLADGDYSLDCEYNFKVTAAVTNAITDNSDSDVILTIGDTTKTLHELITAGTDGIILTGNVSRLTVGTNYSIGITSSVTNSNSNQNDLQGNSYTISIEPYNNGDTKSFSCYREISFTIAGTTYYADVGMTWAEWIDSDYNTSGFSYDKSFIYKDSEEIYGLCIGIAPVSSSNIIEKNINYEWHNLHNGSTL